ncbi:hypothetical protein HYX11_05055 [Candidatus Woesearchaeota archaeon]|nr:hypothetical protein [Candidatus Woesearchaeota archaeon]
MSEQVRPSPPEYKTNVEWGNTIIHTDFYDNRQETESGHALRVRLFRIVLN